MIKKPLTQPYPFLTGVCGMGLHFSFSSDALNVRIPLVDPSTYKPTDQHIQKYENYLFSAYLYKKRVTRSQVWPKIHIMQGVPQKQRKHLDYQRLFPLKKTLDEGLIKNIAEKDPSQINSAYVISMFSEDHFKELVDEYIGKVLVSGKAPDNQEMQKVEKRVIDMYRIFYFGEPLSKLQRQIQLNYLAAKQEKWFRRQSMPKNAYFRCNWRPEDQRLLQDFVNWPDVDMNLTDANLRPFYEPLALTSRLPMAEKINKLVGGDSWLANWAFQLTTKKDYTYSYQYVRWIVEKLLSRTVQYSRCIEFTHNMSIPPDFVIEICVLNIHIWMVCDRLNKMDGKGVKSIRILLEQMFQTHIDLVLGSLNLKQLMAMKKTFHEMVFIARVALDKHFNHYPDTKQNPYKNIDALVWSIAFREKVERYGNEVYLFSQYLVQNYRRMEKLQLQDLLDGMCEFDPFLVDPDYQLKIKAINKPMDSKQFEQQFNSDRKDKAYYYKSLQQDEPVSFRMRSNAQDLKYSFFKQLYEKIRRGLRKYTTTLEEYDHLSEMDEQKQKQRKKAAASPWKNDTHRIQDLDKQFESVRSLRRDKKLSQADENKKK